MAVYVDDMRRPARVGRVTARWSHLLADTRDELDAFAGRLGLRPEWIQHSGRPTEHYDLTDGLRAEALMAGAVAIRYGRAGALLLRAKRARAVGDHEMAARFEAEFRRHIAAA